MANSAGQRTDDQLMMGYARGDRGAFDQLYARYKQPLYHYLYRNCGTRNQVDELFQDVWLRVIASAPRFRNRGRFRSWIFTLAHNCLVDYYRKADKQSIQTSREPEISGANETQAVLLGVELAQSIQQAIASLPPAQREAYILREHSGFSIREIGDIQNISPEAAKSRLRYAYGKLRSLLEDQI